MKQLIHMDREKTDITAESYFHDISGLKINEPDAGQMYEDACAVRDKLCAHIKPRALVRSFNRRVLRDGELCIEGRFFPCNILINLKKESVVSIHAFVLTIGDLLHDWQSIVEAFYADFWGMAYVNAASDALRVYLRQLYARSVYVSEPVSPGFYDMDIKKISELFQIVDGNEIGVHLQGFMMNPLKSCAGFYFVVENEAQLNFLNERCSYCHKGNGGGCEFCRHRKKRSACFI